MKIAGILKQKGGAIVSVAPTDTIEAVVRDLADKRIGAVVVLDSSRRLLGILSERDIVRSLAQHGARTLEMTAAQLMTANVTTATPDTTVDEAMELMTGGRFRHVPVIDHDALCGLISIGDVVKAKIGEAELEVESMRAYVAGAA